MQHHSDRSCLRFPHVEFGTEEGKQLLNWFYVTHNFSDCWYLRGCYICISVSCRVHTLLACASSPHLPRLRGCVDAAASHILSLLFRCHSFLFAAVLWWTCSQVKARLAHISQASPWCVLLTLKRFRTRNSVVPVMTFNSVIWRLFQFWYSACLSVFWCRVAKNCCCLTLNKAKLWLYKTFLFFECRTHTQPTPPTMVFCQSK